ncbi:MAG: glutamine--fructose-6-phosphate transaminase (isomerizing) [Ignavibacteria bacterium]|nr:glutamine--fructose-6-phosphate transaminase (isomerizing) [Ignavibacteria bacterium]
MCGIIGYIGKKNALPILLEGLRRVEYRGYDSAGVATISEDKLHVTKKAGKVAELVELMDGNNSSSEIGIGHTRWATHGIPNDINAHPHWDCNQEIAIIHNGIIENFSSIKTKLQREGHQFETETDTEVLAHLIERFYQKTNDLYSAVRLSLLEVKGAYGLAIISTREPDKIIVARKGSPLVIGIGEGENFIASDAAAIIDHTRQVVYLEDGEVAEIRRDGFFTRDLIHDEEIDKEIEEITFDLEQIEKGGYEHFMLKEIHEQPESIRNTMRGRLLEEEGTAKLGGLDSVVEKIVNARRIILVGCGTSWHAGLVGEYMLEQYAQIPVEVEYASEFRYRNPILYKDDVVFFISQSGETFDTAAALQEAKQRGATCLGICNVVGSTIPRASNSGVYIHAGPEIGVASTKAFTSQLVALALITLMIARKKKTIRKDEGQQIVKELLSLPEKVAKVIEATTSQVRYIAEEFSDATNFLYLGRGYNFPVALEGALKLKEISYIHAEGYPAAEMKHGPIALIDHNMPVVCIAPKDSTYEKVLSNIQEVRVRNGRIIAVANHDDEEISKLSEHVIRIPQTLDFLAPILSIIPLQLLSYYMAVKRGCNVDMPRNLAKSVTVE